MISILVPRGGGRGEGAHGRERSPSHPFLPPHVKRHGRRLNKHHSLRTNPGSAQAPVTQQWCTWVGVGKGGVWQKKGRVGAGASAMRSGLARSGWEGGKRKGSLPLCSVTRKERRKKAEKKKAHTGARIFTTPAFGGGRGNGTRFYNGKGKRGHLLMPVHISVSAFAQLTKASFPPLPPPLPRTRKKAKS